jgi:S1-C subfamily serine protease
MKPSSVVLLSLVCAFVGAGAALLVVQTTGWVDSPASTVVVRDGGGGSATPAANGDSSSKPLTGNGFDPSVIYRERSGGVVTLYSRFQGDGSPEQGTGFGEAQGSGFVADGDGYILTNAHVITTAGTGASGADVKAAETVYVEFKDGDRIEAKVIGWDLFDDVGLIKVDPDAHDLQALPLGDSDAVEVGEPVAAIGSPFSQQSSLSVGVVSATRSIPSLTSQYSLPDAIQIDAPINPGNSGGPLVNARGEVIGLNAQIRSDSGTAEGIGFAVPINAEGKVRYAWLGVTTQTVTPTLARELGFGTERGAAIQSIVAKSPAASAGFKAGTVEKEFDGVSIVTGGDVIVAVDGTAVESAEDVVRAVSSRLPGEEAKFTIFRAGKEMVVTVRFGERPSELPLEN